MGYPPQADLCDIVEGDGGVDAEDWSEAEFGGRPPVLWRSGGRLVGY